QRRGSGTEVVCTRHRSTNNAGTGSLLVCRSAPAIPAATQLSAPCALQQKFRRKPAMSLRRVLAIPDSAVTDETVYRRRRELLGAMATFPLLSLAGCAEAEPPPPSTARVTPAEARAGFSTDEPLTRYEDVTRYNNFYEFGTGKSDPSQAARTLRTSPWHVEVSGECVRPGTLDLDDLLRGIAPTERIY